MIAIIKIRKVWYTFSTVVFIAAVVAAILWGLKFGIDFTGGSLLEVTYQGSRPTVSQIEESLADLKLSSLIVQPVGDEDMLLRFQETTEESHQAILTKLTGLAKQENKDNSLVEQRFESVGPSIGQELKVKSLYAIFFVLVAILIYISYVFLKVSRPVASW